MTPRGGPLSERGKLIAMCLLFPLFWPFLPILLVSFAAEDVRDAYYRWKYRRSEKRNDEP